MIRLNAAHQKPALSGRYCSSWASQRPPDVAVVGHVAMECAGGFEHWNEATVSIAAFFGETSHDPDELLCAEFSVKPTCVGRIRIYRTDVATIQVLRRRLGSLHGWMRDLAILAMHLIATAAKLLLPGGARSVLFESLLLKHQLLIVNRSRVRAPNLRPIDRIIASLCAGLMHPARLLRSAIVLKPSTL